MRGDATAFNESQKPHPVANYATRDGAPWVIKLLREMEFGVKLGLRIVSDPHIKVFRFNYPLFFRRAPELQFIRAQLEMKRLLRTCGEVHPLKSLQLADGARRASGLLMNVELYDLVSSAAAGVGHVNGNIQAGSYFRLSLA